MDLDSLLGTNLPEPQIISALTSAEMHLAERLIGDFQLDGQLRSAIIRALYRFKQLYRHYIELDRRYWDELTQAQQVIADQIFRQIDHNLDRNSRSCFANTHFFGRIRFLLHACKGLKIPERQVRRYMDWLLGFPITPENSPRMIFENEFYPANLPHIYMEMLAGMIRNSLTDKKTYRQIYGEYRTFLRERNVRAAHNRWFNGRLTGSYGSRQ